MASGGRLMTISGPAKKAKYLSEHAEDELLPIKEELFSKADEIMIRLDSERVWMKEWEKLNEEIDRYYRMLFFISVHFIKFSLWFIVILSDVTFYFLKII